jgi:hypothetical protein
MKRLIYQVYVGGRRLKLYDHCIESVSWYCKEHKIDHIVQEHPRLLIKPDVFATNRSEESYMKYGGYLPIYEKENAFEYFNEYDQIAIIDADIFIRERSPNIFDELTEEYDFGGVVERDMPLTEAYKKKILNYSRMQYGSIRLDWDWRKDTGGEFMNMGMMLMNKSFAKYLNGQTPKQFLMRSEFKQFIDGMGPWKWSTDQTLLNYWIKKEQMKVKKLHWKWNGLYTANTKINECHFVHFFLKDKLPQNGENIEELMNGII